MNAISLVLVSLYKAVGGNLGRHVQSTAIRDAFNTVNGSGIPWDLGDIEAKANDLTAIHLVDNPMGNGYGLTQYGKSQVEQSGLLNEWAAFERAMGR